MSKKLQPASAAGCNEARVCSSSRPVQTARPPHAVADLAHPPAEPAERALSHCPPRIPAVKAGRIVSVPDDLLHRPSPRIINGLEKIAALLDKPS